MFGLVAGRFRANVGSYTWAGMRGDAQMLSTWTPALPAVATAADDGDRSSTSQTKVEMQTLDV